MLKTGQIEWLEGCKNTTYKIGQLSIDSCFLFSRESNVTGFGVLEPFKLLL